VFSRRTSLLVLIRRSGSAGKDEMILEIKALETMNKIYEAQLLT